ncbi:Ig-like domain-containing protein [Streptomyces pathocidini]|uniref:Ig-like domain-containing protein n=1 Tax=Streptomyces pathocidini TaxID=1650571 RepID=UPI0033ED512F
MIDEPRQNEHPGPMARRAFVAASGALAAAVALPGGLAHAAASGSSTPTAAAAGDIPAFPGAEGGGKYATGGRGGTVYEVTTLDDSGPGSLRDAVSGDNRTVVFRVSGNIEIKGGLDITGSNLTIAGQTAPGGGICVVGNETEIKGDNIILRYLRFRAGDTLGTGIDCFGMEGRENVIIDHCSFSWAVDENCSPYKNKNVTVQWCIISEPLTMSVHEKGRHGFGGIWGGDNVTYHHNLLVHNGGRNPRFGFEEGLPQQVDHRNNVIYNHGYTSCYGGEWAEGINIVGNYYKPGPNTVPDTAPVIVRPDRFGSWYVAGNVVEGHDDVTQDNRRGIKLNVGGITLLDKPVTLPEPLPEQSAEEAYKAVLVGAGAILPRRDAIDARIVNDVRNGTGRMINSQKEVGGPVPLASTEPPADTDHDGIPDDWQGEAKDGYTRLEVYLNSIERIGKDNPTVTLKSPTPDQVFAGSGATADIPIAVEAAAAEGESIATVEYYAGDKKLGETTSLPHEFTWSGAPDGTHYLTARATDGSGTATTSTCTPVHVNHTTAITPWRLKNIGKVPIAGSAALDGASVTLKGSGKIKGRKDAFTFLYQPISAPADDVVEIIAKVDTLSAVYEGVMAGVMIRENLTPDSAFVMFGITYLDGGLKARGLRIGRYGTATSDGIYPWEGSDDEYLDHKPYWLRITKRGPEFQAHISSDGLNWGSHIVYERLPMVDRVYVGLAVDANKEANGVANYCTATFGKVQINR